VNDKKVINEQDVIRLLKRWGGRKYPYSADLQSKRRSAFLAVGASMLLAGAGKIGISGKSSSMAGHAAEIPMTIATKVTLGVLSTVILGLSSYLGVIVYENRDAIRDFIQGDIPTLVQESPVPSSTESPFITSTLLSSETPTPTPTGTLLVTGTPEGPNAQGGIATSAEPGPTKPGLHIGQTKTPKLK
jgi:hypothetical protein